MTKLDDEIPTTSYAGLTRINHTPFKQAVEAELEKMAQRLHYNPNVFGLQKVLDGDEPGSKVVYFWCQEKQTIRVTAATEDPAAFAKAFEAALKEHPIYKDRFEKGGKGGEGEQADSDTPD